MLTTTAEETTMEYIFTVTDGNNAFEYRWGKEPPQGKMVKEYIQSCKREAELLAADEMANSHPPTPIQI